MLSQHWRTHTIADLAVLHWEPWSTQGIVHGFTGLPYDFSSLGLASASVALQPFLKNDSLQLLNQVHGDRLAAAHELEISSSAASYPCADGWIARSSASTSDSKGRVLGIRTADCLALLMRSRSGVAAVHAGWRGLAQRIISKAIESMSTPAELVEVIIGPCAGPLSYEVGMEVPTKIGSHAVFRQHAPVRSAPGHEQAAKVLLDLVGTAQAEVALLNRKIKLIWCERCTITDAHFHSHRRRGGVGVGSNLGFIAMPK